MKKSKLFLILFLVLMLGFIVLVLYFMGNGVIPTIFDNTIAPSKKNKQIANGKIDDWEYEPSNLEMDYNYSGGLTMAMATKSTNSYMEAASDATMGFSTGGAKDINNFRENIEEGYFPLESDITYEGIFYDYYFDTGDVEKEDKMFYPSATTAISKDPISGNEDYYVSVGLNSNIKESDFSRKKLNVVVVLDISGSMSSSISNYYYDMDVEQKSNKTKMKLAEESVNILIDQLNDDDSFGMVLFDNGGYLAKPLNRVADVDMDAIKEHILEVEPMGGTNFESGYSVAQEVFEKYKNTDPNEYENRIIVITDAMPNIGTTSKEGLLGMIEDSAKDKIYTTFIGVGLDFNTEVIKAITNVRGANYYSVHSDEEFESRMGEEFEYMVTPLVFDLDMKIESDDFELVKIYGTDDIDSENSSTIMHVNSLFPSKSNSDGEVKGGVILLKLKKKNDTGKTFKLNVSFETRDGQKDSATKVVEFKDENYYDNTGIRKAIVLSRYVNLIKDWTTYERDEDDRFLITPVIGIIDWYDTEVKPIDDDYYYYGYYYSENERVSVDLSISEEYKEIFNTFKEYMESEIKSIGDDTMEQEIDIIDLILAK